MKQRTLFAGAAAMFLFGILAAMPGAARAQLTSEEKKLNLDSFEYVWKTIHDKHFDPTFGGLDWKTVRDEFLPKVEGARNMREARSVLREMIAKLGLSHFSIISSEAYQNIDSPAKKGDRGGTTGIDVRVIDGKAIVTAVAEGSSGDAAGVRPGWEIRSIKEEDVPSLFPPIEKEFAENPRKEHYLARGVLSRMHGIIGDSMTVVFTDGHDKPIEKTLFLGVPSGKKVVFGNLPPFYLTTKTETLRQGVGYFAFSCFFDPMTLMPAFSGAMQSFMEAPGMIIDLRGNPGGIPGIALGFAGWLIEGKGVDMGTMRTRDNTLRFVINPRAQVYEGPCAILVDGLSGSSAEIFAGGLQGFPRIRIFGSRTAGATLPSNVERLPNGDGFQYAFASYIGRNGEELEGKGVVPDVEVRPTRKALLDGRDPAVEAALGWIETRHYKGE